jgi:hypothetical protein
VISLTTRTQRVRDELRNELIKSVRQIMYRNQTAHDVAMKTLFKEMDVNGDGWVTEAELRIFLDSINIYTQRHTLDNLFRILDPDRSGGIETLEFERFMNDPQFVAPAETDQRRATDTALVAGAETQ